MKVVITGGAGAIGSHLAESLAALGHSVSVIDAFTSYYDPKIKESNIVGFSDLGIDVHRLDLSRDDLKAALDGAEIIIHLAGQPGLSAMTPFDDYLANNVVATERLLSAAEQLPTLKHFINGATSSVYGAVASGDENTEPKPSSYYGATKLAAEQLVMARHRSKGFPATSLRFFSVYGERERPDKFFHKLIHAIANDAPITLYEGSERHVRSCSYVGDVVNGVVAVMSAPNVTIGEIFNLGNDATATTGEGLAIVEEVLGKPAQIVTLPPRAGDQKETAARIEKIRRMVGYDPKTSLRDGLARQVEWYRNRSSI